MKTLFHWRRSQVWNSQPKVINYLKSVWARLLFPVMSAIALGWFLVRVIPKPVRATYPCQRAAFPLASAFVIWLLAVKSGFVAWLGLTMGGTNRWRSLLLWSGGLGLVVSTTVTLNQALTLISPGPQPAWVRTDPANTPMGTPRGIYAGRVVWMRDTNATPWNGASGHWWDNNSGINQAAVERMMTNTLMALTGATNESQAWDRVFRHYNTTHNRGDVGYAPTDSIAIKINCNNCYNGYGDDDNQIDASPQTVLALLRQLVHKAGVPQNRIILYEAIRVIPNRIYNPCHAEFPDVIWVDSQGTGSNGRQPINWHSAAFSYSATCNSGTSIPELVYQATYLINLAALKGHWRASVSLTAKNHFGSIPIPKNAHPLIQTYQLDAGSYTPFADLAGARNLGGKTMLYMIDGLYGVHSVEDAVNQSDYGICDTLFDGQWSASYFLSLDPVAIDSVGLDFLYGEFGEGLAYGNTEFADDFLHEMAQANNPLSGINYRPDGTTLPSLGVHEHWNNSADKQYSRNLGLTNGIELVTLEVSALPTIALVNPGSMSLLTEGDPMVLQAIAVPGSQSLRQVDFYCGSTLIGTATAYPYTLPWTVGPVGNLQLTAVATDVNNRSTTSTIVPVKVIPSIPVPPEIVHSSFDNGQIRITFRARAGRVYRLDYTDSLNAISWNPVAPAQPALADQVILTNSTTNPSRFYRVVLVQ